MQIFANMVFGNTKTSSREDDASRVKRHTQEWTYLKQLKIKQSPNDNIKEMEPQNELIPLKERVVARATYV